MYNLIRQLSLPILKTLNNDYTLIIPQVEKKIGCFGIVHNSCPVPLIQPQYTDNPHDQNICERCHYNAHMQAGDFLIELISEYLGV